MIGYASRTGTRRNLEALRIAGWGLMVSATGVHRTEGFSLYALDNGAWTAHQRGEAFDAAAFECLVSHLGAGAEFIVVPDIVAGGRDSLRMTERWLPRLDGIGRRRLVAVQDGITPECVRSLLSHDVGLFLGGSTEWKLRTIRPWGELAEKVGCYYHVGRVNTVRRIRLCQEAGANSFDGTSVSRYAKTIRKLDAQRRQLHILNHIRGAVR